MNKKMKTADKAFTLLKNTISIISEFSGVQGTRYFGQMLDLLYKELQWNGILDDSAADKSKEQLQFVLKDAFSEYLKSLPSGKRRLMGTVRADVEYDFFKAVEHASLDFEMIEKSVNRALESAAAGEGEFFTPLDINKMTADFLVIFLGRVRGVTELSSVILWPQVEKLAKQFDDFYVRMDALDTRLTRLEEKDAYYQTVDLLRGIVPERHSVKILSHGAGAVSSYYISRAELDAQIRECIKEQSMILLHGLGGIGKTQLCFYIYRQYVQGRWNDGIDFICYLAFDGDEDQAVYQWVKIKKTNDFKADTEFAWGVLENAADQGRLLILIDDIRHHMGMGGRTKVKLDKIMALHCAVIFFSREDELEGFQPMHVENLPEEACIKLFMDITGKVPDENEQKELSFMIRERWGYHTLIIELAGKAMKESGWDYKEMRQRMESCGLHIEQGDDEKTIQNQIEKMFGLAGLEKAEINILEAFSMFPHLPLSLDILEGWLKEDAKLDSDKTRRVIFRLGRKGWLQRSLEESTQKDQYVMHQIVSEAVRGQNFPLYIEHKNLVKKLNAAMYLDYKDIYTKTLLYLPFAETVSNFLEKESCQEVGNLLNMVGYIYHCEGQGKRAETYYKKAVKNRESMKERESIRLEAHVLIASSYNNLALAYEQQGKYGEAESYYKKSLDIIERKLGKDSLSAATIKNNLGEIYKDQGRYKAAEGLWMESLAVREKELGKDHLDTAVSYNNVGLVFKLQGDYSKAELYYKKSLEIKEKLLGDAHPSLAMGYNNLGCVYDIQGKYEDALIYHQKALEMRIAILGEKHPETAVSYHNLTAVYNSLSNAFENQNDYAEAEACCEKALKIREKNLGTENKATITNYINLADMYRQHKKYDKAESYYKKALVNQKKAYGEDEDTVVIQLNFTTLYFEQGRFEEAEEHCRSAVKIAENLPGDKDLELGYTYCIFGLICERQNKADEAQNYFNKSVHMIEMNMEGDISDPETMYTLLSVGCQRIGRQEDAREYLRKAQMLK